MTISSYSKTPKGFTLIELIIVIAVIAILAAAIFVAVDPARRLHEARNARRRSDINNIIEAIRQYQVDNDGDNFTEIAGMSTGTSYGIGTDAENCSTCTATVGVDSCIDLEDMGTTYLAVMPTDPASGTSQETGYYISIDAEGAITVGACEPEGEGSGGDGTPPEIYVTR